MPTTSCYFCIFFTSQEINIKWSPNAAKLFVDLFGPEDIQWAGEAPGLCPPLCPLPSPCSASPPASASPLPPFYCSEMQLRCIELTTTTRVGHLLDSRSGPASTLHTELGLGPCEQPPAPPDFGHAANLDIIQEFTVLQKTPCSACI